VLPTDERSHPVLKANKTPACRALRIGTLRKRALRNRALDFDFA
jgi:hypothetical protein